MEAIMLTALLQQVVLIKTMAKIKTSCKIYGEYKINKSMKRWRASRSTSRPEVGLDYLQSQRCQDQELVKLQNALHSYDHDKKVRLARGKQNKILAARVMSCLRVSELCDSEANSSMAGQDSTCDFDIRAGLSGPLPKDLWPVWNGGKRQ